MKAIKSESVQTLIIAGITSGLMYYLLNELTLATMLLGGFLTIVGANKVRTNINASKGHYFDKETGTLKTAKNE